MEDPSLEGDAMNRADMLSIRMAPLSDIHLGSSYQVPSIYGYHLVSLLLFYVNST